MVTIYKNSDEMTNYPLFVLVENLSIKYQSLFFVIEIRRKLVCPGNTSHIGQLFTNYTHIPRFRFELRQSKEGPVVRKIAF